MQKFTHTKGFTLVETLVAITILIIVIVGPMTIAQKGVQNAYFANDQVTAVFLAQEAIEAVRELRDEVALDAYAGNNVVTSSWVPNGCGTSVGCAFMAGAGTPFQTCGSANDQCKLHVDTTGAYTHNTSYALSPFTRKVTIGGASNGGVPVEVSVTWYNHGTPREVKLQTWVYDHYERYEN